MASYQQSLRRLQTIVPILFDALQTGLSVSVDDHTTRRLRRRVDPHFFSHGVRRVACEELRHAGLLVTDAAHERSALPMSSIQIDHNGVRLWVFRSKGEIPLPRSPRKRDFYRQVPTLEGWDNVLLLWDDEDGVLRDPMHLVRPTGGDHRRRNLTIDWDGPLSRRMSAMRAADLDQLEPEQAWQRFGDADGA